MKKYKLIKEYPGSPKLNTIVGKFKDNNCYYDVNNINIFRYKNEVENYPCFWEEVIEKDYEILSFKSAYRIHKRMDDAHFDDQTYHGEEFYLKNNKTYKIHSIKRLSDGEIFTIGDEVCDKTSPNKSFGKITKIWVSFEQVRIDINNLGLVLCNNEEKRNYIIHFKKPLFTTEDGVDIFEGDEYYYFRFHSWTFDKARANQGFYSQDKFSKNSLYFSTKEAAEEYILMNKPCLSINDIIKQFGSKKSRCKNVLIEELKEIVKKGL